MQGQKDGRKAATACRLCHLRKVRCGGGMPCQNCLRHDKECFYPPTHRRRCYGRDQERENGSERSFLDRIPPLSSDSCPVDALASASRRERTPLEDRQVIMYSRGELCHENSAFKQATDASDRLDVMGALSPKNLNSQQVSKLPPNYHHQVFYNHVKDPLLTIQSGKEEDSAASTSEDKEEITIPPQKVNWEHHGPGSWISICSQPGLRWVAGRIGNADFAQSARSLTLGWSRRLKFMTARNRAEQPEPDAETAWKYCTAYFEDPYDALGGVIHRPEFEARLRAHFDTGSYVDGGAAWYALRNTVYASGCRTLLFKGHHPNFADVQTKAWRYYENALSVFVELAFAPSGLSAVQAVAAMGIGNPALQYMMCATAARLAYAKGLHRHPAKSWNLPTSEILHRNWLFWAIYCCEKHIAYRSGRPSAIDDDDISCQIPAGTVPGSNFDAMMAAHKVKLAQVFSRISSRLTSVRALQQSPMELIKTMTKLTAQLEQWREELPLSMNPGQTTRAQESASSAGLLTTFFDYAYNVCLTAINQIFAYPWIAALIDSEDNAATRIQVARSTEIVAEAARNMILIAKHVEIEGSSPQWLAFFCPMVGTINLFITILKNPSRPTARSDVALLDIAVGHFGHMEVVTASEVSFPFVREAASIAYNVVRQAEENAAQGELIAEEGPLVGVMIPSSTNINLDLLSELDPFAPGLYDTDGWNLFSSATMGSSSADGNLDYYPV